MDDKYKLFAGTNVVRLSIADPNFGEGIPNHTLGTPGEALGTIVAINNQHATVQWNGTSYFGHTTVNSLHVLMHHDKYRDEIFKPLGEPKFRVDQVVYIKPNPITKHRSNLPAIGTKAETDLKIESVTLSPLESCYLYQVYSPKGHNFLVTESDLVDYRGRNFYKYKDYKSVTVIVDMMPFFSLGQEAQVFDGYLRNADDTHVIKLTPEIKNNLKY